MSFVSGDAPQRSENRRGPQSRRSDGGSSASTRALALSQPGEDVEPQSICCFLCEQDDRLEEFDHLPITGVGIVHASCKNAIRAHSNTMRGQPKLRARNKVLMTQEPSTWRSEVIPFKGSSPDSRRQAREITKEKFEAIEHNEDYKKNERETKKPIWNKRRHKTWRARNDGCGSCTASEEFEDLHEAQEGHYDRGSEQRIRYDDYIEFENVIEGQQEVQGTRRTTDMAESDRQQKVRRAERRRVSASPAATPTARSPEPSGQMPGTAQRSRSFRSLPSADELGPDDSVSAVGCSEMKQQLLSQKAARAAPVAPHRPVKRLKLKSKSTPEADLSSIPLEQITDTQFLMRQDELESRLNVVLEPFEMQKTGLIDQMNAAQAKADEQECDQKGLTQSTTSLQQMFDEVKATSTNLLTALEQLNKVDVPNFLADVAAHEKLAQTVREAIIIHVEALQYKVTQKVDGTRTIYHAQRYSVDKRVKTLVAGKFGKYFAKWVGKQLFDLNDRHDKNPGDLWIVNPDDCDTMELNPDTFDHQKPALYDHPGHKFCQLMQELQTATQASVVASLAEMKTVLNENKAMPGALGPLAHAAPEWGQEFFGAVDSVSKSGGEPWLVGMRKNMRRFGPAAFPVPGIATCYQALDHPQHIILIKGEHLLKQGIVFANMESFIEGDHKMEWLKKHGNMILLAAQSYVYIPFGWLAIPLHFVMKDEKKPEHTFGWAVPLFVEEWFQELAPEVRIAIKVLNEAHFKKQNTTFWKDRSDLAKQLWAE